MYNEQKRLDVISNNLANSATVGFKKEGATSQSFDDVLAYKIKDVTEGYHLAKRIGVNNPAPKSVSGRVVYTVRVSFAVVSNLTSAPVDLPIQFFC